MNVDYKHLIPVAFSNNSRVWIYQSARQLNGSEVEEVTEILNGFLSEWNAHGKPVAGFGAVFFNQFIVLMADERFTAVSGCSTDSSVRVIKQIEAKLGVEMFDRQNLAFVLDNQIKLLRVSELPQAIKNGEITPSTLYFDNTVLTKHAFQNRWIVEAADSWLKSRFNTPVNIVKH